MPHCIASTRAQDPSLSCMHGQDRGTFESETTRVLVGNRPTRAIKVSLDAVDAFWRIQRRVIFEQKVRGTDSALGSGAARKKVRRNSADNCNFVINDRGTRGRGSTRNSRFTFFYHFFFLPNLLLLFLL